MTVLESESNQLMVELVSEAAAVQVEYSGVPRYPTCPDGYIKLGRRCIALTDGAGQECPEGEEVLALETEAEMDQVESILGTR